MITSCGVHYVIELRYRWRHASVTKKLQVKLLELMQFALNRFGRAKQCDGGIHRVAPITEHGQRLRSFSITQSISRDVLYIIHQSNACTGTGIRGSASFR